MRVLVTGGAGFIGSWTVDLLLQRGYRVRILDNLEPRVHPHGKPAWLPREAEFIQGDVANPADLSRALEGVDYVLHLAAYQDYLPEFSRFIHTNAESAALVFELIVGDRTRYPVRKIVFASSQSVCREDRQGGWGALRLRSHRPGVLPGGQAGELGKSPMNLCILVHLHKIAVMGLLSQSRDRSSNFGEAIGRSIAPSAVSTCSRC